MKTDILKKFIKEAVKEAIQEELKDILLEAVKAPKIPVGVGGYGTVNESIKDTYAQPHIEKPKQLTPAERQAMFGGILEEMQLGTPATTAYNGQFQPQGPVDAINGALPEGSVGLDQIMALMNK
jgi:hypothetical protein